MKRRLLYFGHPINAYDTDLEQRLLARITSGFTGWTVENPNQPKHQEGYERYGRETGRGMDYYTREVLPACRGGVFLPFRDGAWGAGVFLEAQAIAARRGGRVWVIHWHGQIQRVDLSKVRALTVEETRKRIRDASGNRLPF